MSVVTTQTANVSQPNSERLHRLAVEAAKFRGLSIGEPLPIAEIVAQGEANGYDSSEMQDLLEREGYGSAESLPVPPQGKSFGELWRPDTQAPNPSDKSSDDLNHTSDNPDTTSTEHEHVEAFRNWCEGKRADRCKKHDDGTYQHCVEHAYSYQGERKRFARFKDVERWFLDEYDKLTTILVTYTRPRSEGETVVEHAQDFYPEYPVKRKRRDCLKATGRYDEYAGVSLLAPKDVAPNPSDQTTHGHDFFLIPGFASSECFDSLREIDGVDVSIRYHRSDKVEAPPAVNRQDLERERGATTALSQEVGANLPVFTAIESLRDKVEVEALTNSARYKAKLDATHCPEYVERWSAHMSCGADGDPATNGVRRWRPLGRFSEVADSMNEKREYGTGGTAE